MIKYYKIVDISTGEDVCEGRTIDISRYLDVDQSSVRKSAKIGLKIKHKYIAREIASPVKELKVNKIHKETEYEETERLLRIYGKTNLKNNKEKIISYLKDKGYVLDIEKYKSGSWIITQLNKGEI